MNAVRERERERERGNFKHTYTSYRNGFHLAVHHSYCKNDSVSVSEEEMQLCNCTSFHT